MPIRRAVSLPLAACAALATLLTVSACEPADRTKGTAGATAGSTPTASHPPLTPEPTTDRSAPEPRGSTVTVGDVVLRVDSPTTAGVRTDEAGPGTRTVALDLAPGEAAQLTLTSPGALDVDSDGSVTVLDGSGTPVAAVGPPSPPSGTEGDAPRVAVTADDATTARVEVAAPDDATAQGSGSAAEPGPAEPVRVTLVAGDRAIESATWGENEGGRSLAVDPTDWARVAGQAGLDLIRTQLVAAEPDAGSATMGDQLVCHAVGAPDKATWNLEPWRPDVGLILTATAHCNPV